MSSVLLVIQAFSKQFDNECCFTLLSQYYFCHVTATAGTIHVFSLH